MASPVRTFARLAALAIRTFSRQAASRQTAGRPPSSGRPRSANRDPGPAGSSGSSTRRRIGYAPAPGDTADPGEIIWAWVPYEEDASQGKDRPVLIIGTEGKTLLGLMLTSRDRNNGHNNDSGYVDIGSGAWDRQGRPSEIFLERVIRLNPREVRRIGAVLDRPRFDQVVAAFQDRPGR